MRPDWVREPWAHVGDQKRECVSESIGNNFLGISTVEDVSGDVIKEYSSL